MNKRQVVIFVEGQTEQQFLRDILLQLGVDFNADLEKTLYHPVQTMREVLNLVGKEYNKHTADTSAITSQIQKEDCRALMNSGKCEAFKSFMQLVFSVGMV